MNSSIHSKSSAPRPRLLIVEADNNNRGRLIAGFTLDGYEVAGAQDCEQARARLASDHWDLVLLEVTPPESAGYKLLRELRVGALGPTSSTPSNLPVVLISSRGKEADRIKGFEFGCDDWITKPYSFGELRGRIAAVLRRGRPEPESESLDFGELVIHPKTREVMLAGNPVELTNKEYALLATLASDPDRVFERGVLLNRIWGASPAGSSRTLDAHACRLRAKLAGGQTSYVLNIWGVGFRLCSQAPRAHS